MTNALLIFIGLILAIYGMVQCERLDKILDKIDILLRQNEEKEK